MKSSSARLRTSLIRPCRVRIVPLMTNASVNRVIGVLTGSLPMSIDSNMPAGYAPDPSPQARIDAIQRDLVAAGLLPGAGRHQLLGALLEPFVQRADGLDRVDLVCRLVGPEPGDARETQR